MMNVDSLTDDRTARARIRDEALRLFAARGPDGVTVRDIATAAAVSPALILRHYGSKDGLRAAVDDHVGHLFEVMITEATRPDGDATGGAGQLSMAEVVTRFLPSDSPVPAYLGRLLLSGEPVGAALFRRLHATSVEALGVMAGGVQVADPDVRAAFMLVNDLAVLILRDQLRGVLGVDPLSKAGLERWGATVTPIFYSGLPEPESNGGKA